jgi:BirA family biotin operon repressor/biotin-[acetyl-CoA-carboxylase] ligase
VVVTPDPDTRPPLDRSALGHLPDPLVVEVAEAVPSTNEVVAGRAREGAAEGTVLVAEHQTAGHGRLGRPWETPPRAALTFSVLLRPVVAPRRWPLLPLLTGVAVTDAVAAVGGPPLALKWPNDVIGRDGLKVAGLLLERVESSRGPAAVVGIGLNVSTTRAELPVPTAGSLVTAGMVDPDRTALLREILTVLLDRYRAWARHSPGGETEADRRLLAAYVERCDTVGRDVRVHLPGERTLSGRARGIDPHGALVVDDGTTSHTVEAGDVVHVRVP